MKVSESYSLKVDCLSVGYKTKRKERVVYENIRFEASSGELIALIGKNGIGKSTLLRTISGLQKPLYGKILINEKEFHLLTLKEKAKKIGIVTTMPVKSSLLKVSEVLLAGRYPHSDLFLNFTDEDYTIIEEVVRLTGINNLMDKSLNEISDGECQRVMIARVLVQDTPIIILDEPTAYLDLPNRYEIIHLLSRLANQYNKTIIFSTHDLDIALHEADTVWLMHDDKVYHGAPEDLIMNGLLAKAFGNENIRFDSSLGMFRISRNTVMNALVTGNGESLLLTCKALERIGVCSNENAPIDVEIAIIKNGNNFSWELKNKSEVFLFNSMNSLILYLKKYNKANHEFH